jgi:hypothetical protein
MAERRRRGAEPNQNRQQDRRFLGRGRQSPKPNRRAEPCHLDLRWQRLTGCTFRNRKTSVGGFGRQDSQLLEKLGITGDYGARVKPESRAIGSCYASGRSRPGRATSARDRSLGARSEGRSGRRRRSIGSSERRALEIPATCTPRGIYQFETKNRRTTNFSGCSRARINVNKSLTTSVRVT